MKKSAMILSPRQLEAIPILVQSKSVKEGCFKAGITKKTYHNWMKKEGFMDALQMERRNIYEDKIESVGKLHSLARDVMEALLKSKSESIKLRAMQELWDIYFRQKEIEIGERLEKLEQILQERQGHVS